MQIFRNSRHGFPKRTLSSLALVSLLGAILIVLARLQYQWSGEISRAEREHMQASLLASMDQFRLQLNNEFERLGFLFQPDASALVNGDWQSYAATCDSLLSGLDTPLIRDIYLWLPGIDGSSELRRLNRNAEAFETIPWPADLEPVRVQFSHLFSVPFRPEPGLRPSDWLPIYQVPLMLQPMTRLRPSRDSSPPSAQFFGCLMLQLNQETMRTRLFPELAKRYFEGPDGFQYQVAVVGGNDSMDLLYKSDSHLTFESFARTDARISLVEDRHGFGPAGPRPGRNGPPPSGPLPRPLDRPRGERPGNDGFRLELLAKHREGSLEAAVAGSRRRNLALSFGILLLLASSMALIVVFARRAQEFAKLQIDFVAGISHELRTPLAVICSAGDNLADGIVANSSGSTRRYGELIRSEGRKLAGMIEQILQYASLRRSRQQYSLRPADMNEIAVKALEQTRPALDAAGFSVDTKYDPDLPMVKVDPAVLSRAIQNLIQNASKYSGESRWMKITTEKARTRYGVETCLSIEDRGMGIDREDLRHIFEPFYRGGAAVAAQIHGTGLGLFMVREALISMGGSITVKSARGKGCIFTIHLPATPEPDSRSPLADEGKP